MTNQNFLLEKERTWAQIEEMRDEVHRNRKTINALLNRNIDLHNKMEALTASMQVKAEKIDHEFYNRNKE